MDKRLRTIEYSDSLLTDAASAGGDSGNAVRHLNFQAHQTDDTGYAPIVDGSVTLDGSPAGQLAAANALAAAFGLSDASKLPPPPAQVPLSFVTPDVMTDGTTTKFQTLTLKSSPRSIMGLLTNANQVNLNFGKGTVIGDLITASGFKPVFATHDPHLKLVIETTPPK
jgi:hypothetical protein